MWLWSNVVWVLGSIVGVVCWILGVQEHISVSTWQGVHVMDMIYYAVDHCTYHNPKLGHVRVDVAKLGGG